MDRVVADCRRFESDANCQLTIIGPADEVLAAAVQHAVASHGHQDTPDAWPAPRDARARERLRPGRAQG
jgi:hypothetical protein